MATLSAWLDADSESNRARQRLELAATEWERLARSRDALWHRRQLREVRGLDPRTLGDRERSFLRASQRSAKAGRLAPFGVLLALGGSLALGGLVALARDRSAIQTRLAAHQRQATEAIREARAAASAAASKRSQAFQLFDGTWRTPVGAPPEPADVRWDEAEALWAEILALEQRAEASFARATLSLELSLLVDPERGSIRGDILEVLLEQLGGWERRGAPPPITLRERLLSLDVDGRIRQRLERPGAVHLTVVPEEAALGLDWYEPHGLLLQSHPVQVADLRSGGDLMLAPGSYRLVVTPRGARPFYAPFLVRTGERRELTVRLPPRDGVPAGYVYVPTGRFLVGSADDEGLRTAQTAPPLHEVETAEYLIGANEVTFADWIAYLEGSRAGSREHYPDVESTKGVVRLHRRPDGWRLALRPTSKEYVARWGEPIRYEGRERLAVQDWRRFPVSGISLVDMNDYLRWLNASGRVPGARLCSDWEWERAARGADGRPFTTGTMLSASAANVDVTYGRVSTAFGPDEVGLHPESDSPFGVHDLAGNALEAVASRRPGEPASGRGGAGTSRFRSAPGPPATSRWSLRPVPCISDSGCVRRCRADAIDPGVSGRAVQDAALPFNGPRASVDPSVRPSKETALVAPPSVGLSLSGAPAGPRATTPRAHLGPSPSVGPSAQAVPMSPAWNPSAPRTTTVLPDHEVQEVEEPRARPLRSACRALAEARCGRRAAVSPTPRPSGTDEASVGAAGGGTCCAPCPEHYDEDVDLRPRRAGVAGS